MKRICQFSLMLLIVTGIYLSIGNATEVYAACTSHGKSTTISPKASSYCVDSTFTQTVTCNSCKGVITKNTVRGTRTHNYGGYSPATSTKCSGVSFTQTRSCSYCGHKNTRTATGTRAHKQGSFSPATSTKCSGVSFTQTATCTYGCGNKTTRTATGTKAHSYGSYSPATSTKCTGVSFTQTRSCTSCGRKETRTAIGTKSHSYGSYSPATSTKCMGVSFTQTRSCTSCGRKETRTATGTRAHKQGSFSPATSERCTGVSFTQTATCTYGCGNKTTRTAIGTRAHSYLSTPCFTYTAKYCDDTSYNQYACKYGCGSKQTKYGNKGTSHYTNINGKIVTPSTCITQGVIQYYCKCGVKTNQKKADVDLSKHEGSETRTVTVKPTCIIKGIATIVCNSCHNSKGTTTLDYDKNNHKPSSLYLKHDGTGWVQYCSDCGVKVKNVILSESDITNTIGSRFTKQYQRVDSSGVNHGGICNMCALTNLLNRKLVVDGSFNAQSNYFDILSVIKTTSGKDARYSDTVSNQIISDGETGSYYNKSYSKGSKTYTLKRASADTVSMIQALLKTHPEGVFVRFGTANHCVVITDYKDGHYYVMDSVNTYSGIYDNSSYSYVYKNIGAFDDSDIDTVGYLE